MNALPSFESGQPLAAADLNILSARIRRLQQRAGGSAGMAAAPRSIIPGEHYAFELREMSGVLYYRAGWIWGGNGKLHPVGVAEWNELDAMRECTIWLEITAEGGKVKMQAYDELTPETNLRRRLGYVRCEPGEDGAAPTWHMVQLLGGLINPYAPRRMLGVAYNGWQQQDAAAFCACDAGQPRHAGAIYGGGYSVDGAEQPPSCITLYYGVSHAEIELPAEHGGSTLAIQMSFG